VKISKKLHIGYLFSFLFVIFAGVIILILFKQMNNTSKYFKLIDTIQENVFELNIISNEFLVYHEERPTIQWQIRYKALDRLIGEANSLDPHFQSFLVDIIQDVKLIGVVFADLVLSHSSSNIPEGKFQRQQRAHLQTQLLQKSQKVLFNTTYLKTNISDKLFSIQKYTIWVSIVSIMTAAFLSILIQFLIGRSITIPIRELIQGSEIISAGNLKFPLKIDRSDEIGQLSKSFDQMINNLKKTMVSRDELELSVKKRTAELKASNRQLISEIEVRKQAEEKLKATELKYRTVADYTHDWEYWQNPDGSLQYVSPSCERICGYSAQDFMANPSLLQDMIVPEDKAVWDEHNCRIPKGLPSKEIQFRIQKPDGKIRYIEHICAAVLDQEGNNRGIRASNRDISERVHYQSETRKLQLELEHMDRVFTISTLTSSLAHEINQPLAAMRSYAQAALRFMDKEHPDYNSVRKALQGIVTDNKRATGVVNRLRDLVKKGPTHPETIDINSIINSVEGIISSELVLRNAMLILDLHPSIPVVQIDSIQIQQVLINLLMNALDAIDDQPFDTRTIVISTRPQNSNDVIISVSDSGGGIPPDDIKTIFSPFHTTKSAGMGLGLSICKSIIEAHGGKITAQNNPVGGAMFSLILPVGCQIK